MALRKTDEADLRSRYPLFIEVGIVTALVILITAFNYQFRTSNDFQVEMNEQEVVEMEEVQQTEQEVEPPPPPKPPVPVEVPNDQIIEEDEKVDFDSSLDLNESLDTGNDAPPPPEDDGKEEEQEVFVVVEDQPQMIGGRQALYDKLEYPSFARKAGIEGRVTVQFVVDENGNVTNPRILKGVHKVLNEEALRVIKQMKFKPGKQRGKAVKVKMSVPINFQLRN
jgi:protein TonB